MRETPLTPLSPRVLVPLLCGLACGLPVLGAPPVGTSAPPKVQRYAEWLIARYDLNHDGQLQKEEWQKLQGNPASIDKNNDGLITVEEFVQHLMSFNQQAKRNTAPVRPATPNQASESDKTPPPSPRRSLKFFIPPEKLPEGLPDWFLARDLDGDAQLTKGEFAPPGANVDLSEFQRLDANQDGLLTADECVHRTPATPKPVESAPKSPPKP